MNLNPTSNSGVNDSPTSSNSPGYNSYIPTFKELQGRKYKDNELVVGYEEGKEEESLNELLNELKGAIIEKKEHLNLMRF